MSAHPQTIITTTTLTTTATTTSIFVPVTTETETTTEIKIPTTSTTETIVQDLEEQIKTKLETWIDGHWSPVTTLVDRWILVPVTVTTETQTVTDTAVTYSTVITVTKPFTYTQLAWVDTEATRLTVVSSAISTETVVPVTGTWTFTEIDTITETLSGTTQISIYMTTITGVETTLTTLSVPADVPGVVGWFKAGDVIRLTDVDDYAELWVNGVRVGTALSNGPYGAGFIPGKCSYTIPQDGYYTVSICCHDNRFGGPYHEGNLDLGGIPVVDTMQPGAVVVETEIVIDAGTVTQIPVDWTVTDYYTITGTKIITETFVPVGEETTTTETLTVITTTIEIDTKTQTQIVTETEGVVSFETITISTYAGMTLTDTETTTIQMTGIFTAVESYTLTVATWLASTIREWIEYVPVTYVDVITTTTLTTTETTTTVPACTQTATMLSVPTMAVTTTTLLFDLDCLGGVYYGFIPIEDVYKNGESTGEIVQGQTSHKHIF